MIDRDLLRRAAEGLRSELGVETPFYIYELIRELEEHYFSTPSDATDKPAVFRYKEDPLDLRSRWLYATKEKSIPKGFPYESLYTHQPKPSPARKPMTEEELRKAFLSTNTAEPLCEGWPGLERFARAIEKHHGIDGNPSEIINNQEVDKSRKPMTHEEIIQGVTVDTSDDFHAGYWAGIRFAEKHHGIGVDDGK